jgi:hypothetical protein
VLVFGQVFLHAQALFAPVVGGVVGGRGFALQVIELLRQFGAVLAQVQQLCCLKAAEHALQGAVGRGLARHEPLTWK